MKCGKCKHEYVLREQRIVVRIEHSLLGETAELDHDCPSCGNQMYKLVFDEEWLSTHNMPSDDSCNDGEPEVRNAA